MFEISIGIGSPKEYWLVWGVLALRGMYGLFLGEVDFDLIWKDFDHVLV
jgi:hypothetical protein